MGRLPLPPGDKKYQIQALNHIHHEILRLAAIGMKRKMIAAKLGVTPVTVTNCLNSERGRALLNAMQIRRTESALNLMSRITDYAPTAFEKACELLEDDNTPQPVQAKLAIDLLGLAGYVKPQKVQLSGTLTHFTSPEIEAIKARARQLSLAEGDEIIEGEFAEQQFNPAASAASEEGDLPSASLSEGSAQNQRARFAEDDDGDGRRG